MYLKLYFSFTLGDGVFEYRHVKLFLYIEFRRNVKTWIPSDDLNCC